MEKEKIVSLQALRALAFLGIFTSHCGSKSALGAWGVSVFIILSGFLMYVNYKDKPLKSSLANNIQFSINKIKKLYPLHILTMILAIPFMLWGLYLNHSTENIFLHIGALVLNTFLLQTWIPIEEVSFSLNSVSWYLSLCLFLYFSFPFLMNIIKRFNSKKKAIFTMIGVYVTQILIAILLCVLNVSGEMYSWFTYILPPFRMGDFFIGCCLGYIYVNRSDNVKDNKLVISLLEIVTILLTIVTQLIYLGKIRFLGIDNFGKTILYVPTSVAIVYLFSINRGIITKALTNKYLVFVGDLSAFAFLIHNIIVKYYSSFARHIVPVLYNVWIEIIICLIITLLCSYLWKIINNKLLKELK